MARTIERLKATSLKINKPGFYPDGRGLYLQVTGPASKSWVFRYARIPGLPSDKRGKEIYMGLGSAFDTTLAEARAAAMAARKLRQAGIDPVEHRKAERKAAQAAAALEAAKSKTFDECATAFISTNEVGWKNPKHRQQWKNSLANYASPVLGKVPVRDINIGLVLQVLESIWTTKTETAVRVQGRIKQVLAWATVRGYRSGDNPADWKGCLEHLLPAPASVRAVENYPSLPYAQINAFLTVLRASNSVAAPALEFQIMTGLRPGVVRATPWSEIDLEAREWNVPAERMKMKKAHRVPLNDRAMVILRAQKDKGGTYVFCHPSGKLLSENALGNVVKQLPGEWRDPDGRPVVPHGFRSTFKTWASECAACPPEIVEAAMAHEIGGAVERIYLRSDFFERRRKLMADWVAFCEAPQGPDKVVPIRSDSTASFTAA